jgi:hypothetical protein
MSSDGRSVKQIEIDAINEFSSYLKGYEHFNEDNGIFQPIRAIVRIYDRGSALEQVINDAMNCMNTACMSLSGTVGENLQRKTFKEDTVIVGYLSARSFTGSAIGFGCSFCRPNDYPNFQKYRGQLIAMPSRVIVDSKVDQIATMEEVKELNKYHGYGDGFLHVNYLAVRGDRRYMYDFCECGNKIVVYYFPFPLNEQLDHFVERCSYYFCKENKKFKQSKKKVK